MVRFDHCDINDLSQLKDRIETNGNIPPLLLLIGYEKGVQAWVVPGNGEAEEVFSWRQGPVYCLKVLVNPTVSEKDLDRYSLKRPIFAICDAAGPGPANQSVSFISMKTGEQVRTIQFKSPVQDILCNQKVVVISFSEKLAVFESTTFDDLFTITTCYLSPGPSVNPVALGVKWLAFADRRLHPIHKSLGGVCNLAAGGVSSASYRSSVIHAAKSITKGLKELGETVASNWIGQKPIVPPGAGSAHVNAPVPQATPGIVTIIDVESISGELNLGMSPVQGLVAHFVAHQGLPLVAMEFDASGLLLATADKAGHAFHIFRVQPFPSLSTKTAIHHLYTLCRGDTTAKVIDFSFSLDSRWIAVSTHRGTTHVFPITPYGGSIGYRTHTSLCVVNRLSRYQKSAGLNDNPPSGRNSPNLSASPGVSPLLVGAVTPKGGEATPNLAYPNPRYSPYPLPTQVSPLAQLRQPLLQNLIETISPATSQSSPPLNKSHRGSGHDTVIRVCSVFASPRGAIAGSPTVPMETRRQAMEALFVATCQGTLIEYHLEPVPASTVPPDKITQDSPVELKVHPAAEWMLTREPASRDLRPPLHPSSPLLLPLSQKRECSHTLSQSISLDRDDPEERWMAQVEITTHAGPHRRLWMGPQFTFKPLPSTQGPNLVICNVSDDPCLGAPNRTYPMNMPSTHHGSGSTDQSPRILERYSSDSDTCDTENFFMRLRSDIADAMMDTAHGSEGEDDSSSVASSHQSGDLYFPANDA